MKEEDKVYCKLIGENSNIFNLLGKASQALTRAGKGVQAVEMSERVWNEAQDFDEALSIILEYVTPDKEKER